MTQDEEFEFRARAEQEQEFEFRSRFESENDPNNFNQQFQQAPVVGGVEALGSMISSLPGQAAGGIAAAGQGLMALPEMVGLPGIGGATMANVPGVYRGVEEAVNERLQYEPRTEVGKRYTQKIGELSQQAVDLAGAGGAAVGGNVGEAVARFGAQAALEVGVPSLGIKGATKIKPGLKETAPGVATDFKSKLDQLDKAKEEQKLTQGEGTLYVGKDGDVTTDLPGLVKETPEQVEIARTEMQNNLQREATAREEPAQGELFLEEPVQGELDLRTTPKLEEGEGAVPIVPHPKSSLPIPEPHEVPKWKETIKFLEEKFGSNPEQLVIERNAQRTRRGTIFDDNALDTAIPFKLKDGTDVVRPDGTVDVNNFVKAMFESDGAAKNRSDLLALLKDIQPYIADVVVSVVPDRNLTFKKANGAEASAPAVYFSAQHEIKFGTKGWDVRTAVHELVHAGTVRALNRWIDPVTQQLKKGAPQAANDLSKLLDHVRSKASRIEERSATDTKSYYALEGARIYGLENVKEFASEVMTNRYLQKMLNDMDGSGVKTSSSGKTIFEKFKNAVGKLFGITNPKVDTILKKSIDAVEGVMAYQQENAKELTSWMQKRYGTDKVRELVAAANHSPDPSEASSAVKVTDEHTAKADVIENISGELYIPKDPVVDEALVNKIKAEKDGSNTWALTPGALARAELANSTLVKTVYRFMNNAFKRGEYKINQVVKPTQETFTKLLRSPQKAAMSHEILMREMRRGEDYTTEELRGIGVPDDLIKAHLEFRSMMQQALEAQNMVLRDKGLPPVKGIDAYVSSRWSGPWRANVKDAEGNIIWQVAEHSKKKAQDAIEWIKTKQPELKIEDPAYRKGFEKGDDVEAGYLDMLKILDKEDPRVAVLESIYKDYVTGNTENVASQEKHFLRKKGVRGFAGDRPWSENDVRDFFIQQFAYAENSFRWAEAQKGVEGVKKLVNDPVLQETQKNNIQFSKEYTKGQLGFGTSATFDAIDNGLAEITGLSPQQLQEYMGAGKTLFYLSKLGLSIPFTITQFLQPAITTPAWHSQLGSMGYKHNPVVTTLKSITGGASAALWHYGQYFNSKELSKSAELGMSKLDKEAARYMEFNGVIDINPMTDIKKGLRPAAVKTIAAPFEFTIKHSEIIARSNAFMGFVSHLEQSGKYDTSSFNGRMELFQKAEDMTSLSMTDYRSQERAMVFEKMGLVGDAAATLHQYQINNLMQLVKFSKEASNGNVLPLFYMMAMQSVAAGLTGLWFVEDLDDFLSNLKKLLPHDQFMKVKDFSLKNFILKHAGDVAGYGLVSKATGTNIHTRMNASNQIPIWPFESQEDPIKNVAGLAPFAESLYDTGMGAAQAVAPGSTPQERMQGLYAAAPTVAQGPMENLPAFSDAGVSLKPRDLGQGKIRRTEEEKSLRNLGLKSTREQKQADQEFGLSKIERQVQDRLNTASKKAVEFAVSGDGKNASEQMIKYIELGGDPQTLVARIPQAKLNRVTTELERRAIGASAGTRAAILKLQRYMDQVTQ